MQEFESSGRGTHPSESRGRTDHRAFGLSVGGVFFCIGGVFLFRADGQSIAGATLAGLGSGLVVTALISPARLAKLNHAWHGLGTVLARFMNPVMLTLMYVATIIPTALVMRALRRDPLRLRFDASAKSYWIERDPPGPAQDGMRDQF